MMEWRYDMLLLHNYYLTNLTCSTNFKGRVVTVVQIGITLGILTDKQLRPSCFSFLRFEIFTTVRLVVHSGRRDVLLS